MFEVLQKINQRPAPFAYYTASELWTNAHTAQQMLQYHLNDDIEASSRNSAFIDASCDWIADKFALEGKKVIDLGCGPGLYASRLAQRGAQVTGLDFSENSINYARENARAKGLNISYVVGDYLEYQTTAKFDLIIMIMCDFCALSPAQRQVLLNTFKEMLEPDGSILMDVYSLARFNKQSESATYEKNQLFGFWSPHDYYGFVNTFKYDDEKVMLDKYTIIEEKGEKVVYNWLQHFSPETLQTELKQAGLIIKETLAGVAGGEYQPAKDEFGILAGHLPTNDA